MKHPVYMKYRPSGVEWLGNVPEHWEVKRLKYSASINDEVLPETTSPDLEFAYVDIGSIDPSAGIVSVERMVFEKAPSRARRIVRNGDTIISTVRTYLRAIAPIRALRENLIVSTGFAVVRPRSVEPSFLSYALRESSFIESVVARSVGVSYPATNASEIAMIHIPLPPPTEQYAIAQFLDAKTAKLDTLVAKKQALIEKLKEKRYALISQTVTRGLPPEAARAAGFDPHPELKSSDINWIGDIPKHWQIKRLGYLTSKVGSGKTPKGGAEVYQSDGVMLIRSQNVHDNGLRFADMVFISESVDEEMAGTRVIPGDVLLNITGASLGRCAIAPLDLPRSNVNQHVCIVRLQPSKVLPEFVQREMTSLAVQSQIFSFENGSSREGLNFLQVRSLLLATPPLPEQRAIADYLDREVAKLDLMGTKMRMAIGCLQEYRTSLISAAVTGKIDIRGVTA